MDSNVITPLGQVLSTSRAIDLFYGGFAAYSRNLSAGASLPQGTKFPPPAMVMTSALDEGSGGSREYLGEFEAYADLFPGLPPSPRAALASPPLFLPSAVREWPGPSGGPPAGGTGSGFVSMCALAGGFPALPAAAAAATTAATTAAAAADDDDQCIPASHWAMAAASASPTPPASLPALLDPLPGGDPADGDGDFDAAFLAFLLEPDTCPVKRTHSGEGAQLPPPSKRKRFHTAS